MKELYDLGAAGDPSLPAVLVGAAELSRLCELDGGVRGRELPDNDLKLVSSYCLYPQGQPAIQRIEFQHISMRVCSSHDLLVAIVALIRWAGCLGAPEW